MKLIVNNLGAVRHAEVDLSKDLLLFTGANNTGKTYLASVVLGLFAITPREGNSGSIDLDKKKKNEYERTLDMRDHLKEFIEITINVLKENLPKIFATDKQVWNDSDFNLILSEEDGIKLFESTINFTMNINEGNKTEATKSSKSYNLVVKNDKETAFYFIVKQAYFMLFFNNHHTPHFFTSERPALNVFSKELSLIKGRFLSSIVQLSDNSSLLDLATQRINRYPLPIQMSLFEHESYDVGRKKTGDFAHLAVEIEAQFLSGKVSVTEGGDLQFSPDGNGKILEIHTTSSTVKSLSPIVFYLRHQAQKGDFIIIDEPELNLHPDNQRKIAKFFGRLINEGFKVLISTHSDYIVRELNNLIMLGSGLRTKPEETRALMKTYGYAENELLKKEQIAPYLFRVGKDVAEIPVTETGFSVETIDEEAQKMNQSSQNIYFTLFDE